MKTIVRQAPVDRVSDNASMAPNDETLPKGTTRQVHRRLGRARRRCGLAAFPAVALLSSALVGCSPTLDWREQTAADVGLRTTFPCHPDRHAREVALAGKVVRMEMLACGAGGATYAVGFFDVSAPAEAAAALSTLRSVWIGNLQSRSVQVAPRPPEAIGLTISGMSPNPEAGQWLVQGHRPDGSALTARGAFFNHGMRVYQAMVIGGLLSGEAVEPFFAGLGFPG